MKKWHYDGYEGNLTGWFLPYCTYSWHARLIDADYSERAGTYFNRACTEQHQCSWGHKKGLPQQKMSP